MMIIGAILSACLISGAGYSYYNLHQKNKQLQEDKTTLERNIGELTRVNADNLVVIKRLNKDKAKADKLIAEYYSYKQKYEAATKSHKEEIRRMSEQDSINKRPVSPVIEYALNVITENLNEK